MAMTLMMFKNASPYFVRGLCNACGTYTLLQTFVSTRCLKCGVFFPPGSNRAAVSMENRLDYHKGKEYGYS